MHAADFFFPPYKEATIVVSSGNILQWEKNVNSLIVFQRPKQPSALEIKISPPLWQAKRWGNTKQAPLVFKYQVPRQPHMGGHFPLHPPRTGLLLCLLQGALSTPQQQSGAYWFTGMQRVARRALPAPVTIPCLLRLVSSAVTPRGNPNFRQQCEMFLLLAQTSRSQDTWEMIADTLHTSKAEFWDCENKALKHWWERSPTSHSATDI